ncbi:branched-chain amino acid ABC transporter permease [Nocardioides sp. CER19]|uniref:branched-chain amino acid ABC transporter permease n=1 Tax=Nocardioides sp. CER19 TaxID=3038538 RepID=UPI0024493D9D|nr:branched-chain amino acid ABC transporter permease [Nocardioides sp. CER19]MDH2416648.1 branched-chain amino acid ABC transporter permease [Nocardioides sp. CER19]
MNFHELFAHFGDITVDGLTKGSIYALVALGYTLVYGVLKLINFAHSEVFMVGTWTVLGAYSLVGADEGSGVGILIIATVLGFLLAPLASAGTALAVERIAYRPLRRKNAPPLIFLITAIGCSLVLTETFGQALHAIFGPPFGRAAVSIPSLIPEKEWVNLSWIAISNTQILVIVAAIVMMVALDAFVNRSRLGRGVRAVAQDPDTAALMGVNQDRVIMLIFVLGGAMAGIAAMLYTIRYDITKFDIGFLIGVKAFTAAVLGGIGNLRGALVGGLVLGVVEVYSSTLFSSNWEDVTAFVVLVLVLMFRPTGILGESLAKARA